MYEHILKEIKKPNRVHARQVLQCLIGAVHPLHIAELAEVLTVNFNDTEEIPRLKPDWWWEEQELAFLLACLSLIAIIEIGGSQVVQFSHFSVKEFLTLPCLTTAGGEVSNYHIDLESAYTILGQACLGVLLQIQDEVKGCTPKYHPLAQYTAEHWTTHVQFGKVLSRLHKGIEYLFNKNKPHFKVWFMLCEFFFWNPLVCASGLAALCSTSQIICDKLKVRHMLKHETRWTETPTETLYTNTTHNYPHLCIPHNNHQ